MRNPLTAAAVVILLAAGVVAQNPAAPPAADCRDAADCQQRALDALERKDYETFHDLAWRAVQRGPKNDPALLFLLARAQSLSGRPLDAIVMLRRLAPTGFAATAVTSVEFERVRALKDWPQVEAMLTGAPPPPPPPAPVTPPAAPRTDAARGAAPPAAGAPVPGVSTPASPAGARVPEERDAMTFAAASFKPAALAYDAVSRRFIISDTDVGRLAVVDEFSRHLATLATGKSAGFGIVTAIEIDSREGNLWVASVDAASGAEVPALHKLQLISGRVLKKFSAADSVQGRLVDIAMAGDGAVVAIQESGRILRLRAGGASLEVSAVLADGSFTSLATSVQGASYVTVRDGVLRFRPAPSVKVRAPEGLDLGGLARIRWSHGSLIGLQSAGDGTHRVVRIRIGRDGRSATSIDVLDPSVRTPNPSAVTLSGDAFYYLAATAGSEIAIRRVIIK